MTDPGPPREEPQARARDLAVGLSKVFQPWFVGLLVVGVILLVLALGANRPADPSFADQATGGDAAGGVNFENRRLMVGDRCLRVLVAATPEQKAQGLKNRTTLGQFNGMLFEFDAMGDRAFSSAGIQIPLTVGFYDEAGTRVDAADMAPCAGGAVECPTVGSTKGPFKNALQVGVGQLPDGALGPSCPDLVAQDTTTTTASPGFTYEERSVAIGERCLRVQVADTQEKQNHGLRDRDSLGDFDGMLFTFDSSAERAFTMAGVKFPLTIGFYDDAGMRVDALDMEPCSGDDASCPQYRSKVPFRTALEVAKGQLPDGPYVPTCPG
ncbi:MAG: DUF192 domain-containing protein [Acidimicrobiia bacterium]